MSIEKGFSDDLESKFDEHRQTGHTGLLDVSKTEAYVSDEITVSGRNLPESEPLDIVWQTATGGWGILGGNKVVGPQFQPREQVIQTVLPGETGSFAEEWTIPEDYGGQHTIELRTADGESIAATSIDILPWFELNRTDAPLGEEFTISGYGLGPNVIKNNYQVTWDGGMVGFMIGTMDQGTATAEIRAIGPLGDHVIQVWRNVNGVPFLQNNTQSPFGPVAGGRQSKWKVEVTHPKARPEPVWMDELVREKPLKTLLLELDHETDAELSITPTSGQPGTSAAIEGRKFPTNTTVDLLWHTHVGNRVAGIPIAPEPRTEVLPTVTTDGSGEFRTEITIPNGLGGTRPIVAEVDGNSVAQTGFVMQPKVLSFSPHSGPVGTDIEIELTGLGWTMYENAYYFVYDNRPMGFVCGLDVEKSEGVVRTEFQAAGQPGFHFIDVYPSFFETEEDQPDVQKKAHLSYKRNHPVRPLPALHFAFEVTKD